MEELRSTITDGVMTKVGHWSSVSHHHPMVFRLNLVQRRTKVGVVSPLTELVVSFGSSSHFIDSLCPSAIKSVMPKDLGIDWKLVEAEYMRGTRPSDICQTYGLNTRTLKTRIFREGWVAKRLAIMETLEAKKLSRSIQTLDNRATSYLQRVVKQVDRGLDVLEAQPPSDVKEVDRHFEALGKIDKVARPALGLTDQSSNGKHNVVNIAVLQQVPNENKDVVDIQEDATQLNTMPIVRQISKETHSRLLSEPQSVAPSVAEEPSNLSTTPDQLS